MSIFFRLSWHFKREKPVFWKASFLQNKDWLRVHFTRTSFVYKTSRLVRISLLINALNNSILLFFLGNLFYKSNRKLFSCVCIAWYKHERGWENSIQLCKPETKSRLNCLEFSKPLECLYQVLVYSHSVILVIQAIWLVSYLKLWRFIK